MIRVNAQAVYDDDSYPLFHWRFGIENQFRDDVVVQKARLDFIHPFGHRWSPKLKKPYPLAPLESVQLDFYSLSEYDFLEVQLTFERASQRSRVRFLLPIHESLRSLNYSRKRSGRVVSSASCALGELGDFLSHPVSKRGKVVLVLGKDTANELLLLREIQRLLGQKRIKSVLLKDLPDVPSESLEQKLFRVATQVSYVIVEHSHASGHIAELRALTAIRVPTAVICQHGKGATWMQADYDMDFAFMRFFQYDTLSAEVIATIENWANSYLHARSQELDRRFPWRVRKQKP